MDYTTFPGLLLWYGGQILMVGVGILSGSIYTYKKKKIMNNLLNQKEEQIRLLSETVIRENI